ncbi:MAG: serine hydroxymethyltransferase [Candidatus Lokiarchaeota archaeon]|nr:serine hydroxymethyltransferase [Candidatus Lokiarchaeota archaeon]MBD3200101.1 serine hydroxymethyltransferase [Candidatus Lokiarchaeota archaeon]
MLQNAIPLIASENITSPAVDEACASDFSHRYAEGWVGERVYAGTEYIDKIETICMELARQYFDCVHADVRPISGVVANLAMYNAFTSRNNGKMLIMPIPKGGHISHAPKYTKSGRAIYGTAGTVRGLEIEYMAFDNDEMNIDPEETAKIIREFEPELVLFGGSVFLFPHPVKELVDVAKEVGASVGYDAAHVAGLIGSGYFQDPLKEGADCMTMSTHKTLPGPQHGAITTDKEDLVEDLKSNTFPALLSNHHLHNVAGLAVALTEMLEFGKKYHKQVIENAKALGQALNERGMNVLCEHKGFTESHQIVLDIVNFKDSIGLGGDIERILEKANIIINRNLLPWDIKEGRHYMNPGGLRLGTSEVTRLGMGKSEMEAIADFFEQLIVQEKDPLLVKDEVAEFRKQYQSIKYCFQDSNKAYEYLKFY